VTLNPRTSRLRRIIGFFAVGVVSAGVVLVILITVFGLRFELAGSGMRPMAYFGDREAHDAALEADRSQQPSGPVPDASAESRPVAVSDSPESVADAQPDPATAQEEEAESLVAAMPPVRAAPWPNFRGPNRDGQYTQSAIRTDWPADGLPRLWSQPIGGGYASFVVAEGRAFTIEQRRDQEVVAAYGLDTGLELWTHRWDADFREPMGGPGPRATPTWHDGRLYALGATGRLWSLDAETGQVLWERDILAESDASNLQWAMSAAPLVVDDLVVVQPGGRSGWSVVAYDRITGEVAWHVLDDVQAYTSPMLVTLAGQRQVLVVTADRVAGLAPGDGRLLWEHPRAAHRRRRQPRVPVGGLRPWRHRD
jgi:hypothetical protein